MLKRAIELLDKLVEGDMLVIDIESNGLLPWHGNTIIGYALGFPRFGEYLYVPVAHGTVPPVPPTVYLVKDSTKQESVKKARLEVLGRYAQRQTYQNENPAPLIEALNRASKRGVVWLGHNLEFDMTFLALAGITAPEKTIDTLIGLHILNEDMRGIAMSAPCRWSKADLASKRCTPEQVGQWKRNAKGELVYRKQYLNKELKFMSAVFKIPKATTGEERLAEAVAVVRRELRESEGKAIDVSAKSDMWLLPTDVVGYYAALDAELTYELYRILYQKIDAWGMIDLWQTDCDISRHVTWVMHMNGIRLDRDKAQELYAKYQERAACLTRIITNLARTEAEQLFTKTTGTRVVKSVFRFNPLSNNDLLALFNHLIRQGWFSRGDTLTEVPYWWENTDWSPVNITRTLESTNDYALYDLRLHWLILALTQLRAYTKESKTYIRRWEVAADAQDIVHFGLNVTGTVSGRLSGSGFAGNPQNIPKRTSTIASSLTIPYKDWVLVGMDYKALELYLACYVAEYLWGLDPDMTMSKVVTGDPHSYTRDTVGVRDILFYKKSDEQIAAEVRLVPTEKMNLSQTVADYLRFVSKTMNFGLLYGGGAGMLSKLLHIDKDSAGQLAMAWRGKYVAFPQANKKAFDDASDYRPLPSDPNRYENYVIQPIIGRARRFTFYEDAIVSKSWPKGTKLKDRTAWNAIKLEKYPKRDQQRKAFNNIIQGMGGGIANQSALRAVHALKDLIRPFLLVHDSFDFYCPAARLDEVIGEVQHIMTDWPTVPKLVVSTEVSDANWQEARKYVRS